MLEFFKSTGRTPARAAAIGGAVGGPPPPKRLKSGSDEDTLDLALVALPRGPGM